VSIKIEDEEEFERDLLASSNIKTGNNDGNDDEFDFDSESESESEQPKKIVKVVEIV
jgi:hypothetical protein